MKNGIRSLLTLLLATTLGVTSASRGFAQTPDDQARAIADILTVVESENAYAAMNCGYFSDVVNLCRSGPDCHGIGIPGYPATSPEFIEGRLGRMSPAILDNDVRSWVEGLTPPQLGPQCDPNSVLTYCYVAEPLNVTLGRPVLAGTEDGTVYIERTGGYIPCPVPVGQELLVWPGITTPAPGSILPGASVTFQWTENDVPTNNYRLLLGTTPGGSDLFDSGLLGTVTSVTAMGLPTDGSIVYARLEYRFADRWRSEDVKYQTMTVPPPPLDPELLVPAAGTRLPGASVLFEWTPNHTEVLGWRLKVGSRPNGSEYFRSGRLGRRESVLVEGLPTDGSLVFTRLLYRTVDGWRFLDRVNVAAFLPTTSTPALEFPVPGTDLPSDRLDASWRANDTDVVDWWLYAGSARGRNDYFTSGRLETRSVTITGLPRAGSPVYLRLWYRDALGWHHRDFAFGSVDLESDATKGGWSASRRRPSWRAR